MLGECCQEYSKEEGHIVDGVQTDIYTTAHNSLGLHTSELWKREVLTIMLNRIARGSALRC